MENLAPRDLKTILCSKRATLYYLQHCRMLVNGGRVEYVNDAGKKSAYWNVPIANTKCIAPGISVCLRTAMMAILANSHE